MTVQDSNRSDPDEPSPLQDPSRWPELIEGVRPDAFLVVIASSMSEDLRDFCSPEDIWQETLVRAWNARLEQRWQGQRAFRAWLFEIARNCIRDAVRRKDALRRGGGRRPQRISDRQGPSSSGSAVLPPDSGTPSRILMETERAASMERGLASLPPDLERVVRMHLVEGLTMEVVAERLGIGVSAAWRRFRKGVKLCSSALSDWNKGGSRS